MWCRGLRESLKPVSVYDAGLSVSYRSSRFACDASSTSRFGFVDSSVYSLSDVGNDASPVNGLNHGLSRIRTQLPCASTPPPLMIRVLFYAGPWVIRIVSLTRSVGLCGPRPEALPVSVPAGAPPVFRKVTW